MFSLAVFFLLAGLVAGCGGSDETGSGSQDAGENGGGGDGGAAKKASETTETKIALGEVISVKPDKEKIVLRKAVAEDQGGERMVFKVKKNARITLAGKEAEFADAKEGQQAQVEYVVSEEKTNRAKAVQLFEGDGGSG